MALPRCDTWPHAVKTPIRQSRVQVRVPAAEARSVSVANATVLEDDVQDGWRYLSVQL